MCGINGIYAFHPASSAPKNAEMLATRDAMRLRGPDGTGEWWSEERRVGLGHRRLSIIDLSDRALQPMVSADGRYIIVFNGEIYNYPELRAELLAQGVQFRTTSDTEALLHLYARDGVEMVHRLRGMFAFAVWDNAARSLFLGRDPYGIKPLYTANDGWTFRFASQVKALLAGGEISHDPEPAGLVGFHLFGSVPEPFTLYRDIRSLPAGHTQWVDAQGAREPKPYINLAAVLAEGARHRAAATELPERLRAAALDSVRAHMLADVEVGAFLSGGVDSGSLLGLMRDAGQRDVRAITLAFAQFHGTPEDEAPLAARVAAHYNAKHIVRTVTEEEFVSDLPAILAAMDQPSIDGVNTWFVSKAAKEAGLKVAISGLGGDELLAGYPSFREMPIWRRRYGWLAAIPGLGALTREVMRALLPGHAKASPKSLGLLEYADSWPGLYLLRRGLFLPKELPKIMDGDLAREGLRRLTPLHRLDESIAPDPGSSVARICALESANYMRNQLLRDADWAGMAHSLEIRVPLVDAALLKSFASSIPNLKPGAGKAALANAPSLPMPDEVVNRAKTGFYVPTEAWMGAAAGLRSGKTSAPKGVVSRRWSSVVLSSTASRTAAMAS